MSFDAKDEHYMRRALKLAAYGLGHVSPNPMVGAVITDPSGRIIGEGWHRQYGGPHAEVNAVRSVKDTDKALLGSSTIYVTLEPCSHYGKTPPCAKLLADIGIGRVVVAAGDPNPKVSGRGIAMLRQAGIQVEEGLLAEESRELNKTFMTAQTLGRPFVTLKWARSADGFKDIKRQSGEAAARFSTTLSSQLVHWRRATHDAIAVGATTAIADNPRLDVRMIDGKSPRPIIFDRHGLASAQQCRLLSDVTRNVLHISTCELLEDTLKHLFEEEGISSLLVEGGAKLLSEFIATGLWDEAFEEVSPCRLGSSGRVKAPHIEASPSSIVRIDRNLVNFYSHKSDSGVKNI